MRRDHAAHLKKFYWKPVRESRSYFVASCGGAPLAVVKQYIQQQSAPHYWPSVAPLHLLPSAAYSGTWKEHWGAAGSHVAELS